MAIYKCKICGFVYDEEKEGRPVSRLDACPVCRQTALNLLPVSNGMDCIGRCHAQDAGKPCEEYNITPAAAGEIGRTDFEKEEERK